ncbi:MAG TPA: protein kinase [Vicinamibacterales bacterium]|nr:protein kinase [Vicinamibacterales bacterium]
MSSLYERAGEVLLATLSRPAAERDAFLVVAFAGDEDLLREVESLLLYHTDGDAAARPPDVRKDFAAGDVFAGRYRMIARVGRGGMGDVWRADDLILETAVALKLMHAASASDRGRILREVRLARQITHPAVCRVFDVGEAGETIFFSMELVQGEDLAALLRRTGRLTSERVLAIAHQLCDGLAAAHAEGVLHRDLKPANVLIDQHGRIRITDFGIAVTTSDAGPHAMVGTLGYMAPEQLSGEPLSERTDVYALGVLLYELSTGLRHQTSRAEDASRLSLPAPGIDSQLERAILKAIARDPRDRPATALELAAALPAMDPVSDRDAATGLSRQVLPRAQRIPTWLRPAGAVVLALVAGTAVFWWTRTARGALTARDTIIIADFLNTTGDPVFDSTLKVALAVGLEQSPFLKVFPDERARQALALMQRSPNEGITRAMAREIAQREGLKALVAGSIASLGQHYVLSVEAANAEDGDVMAREQVEVRSKEEVLASLGAAISKLRRELGESLSVVQRYNVPLPRATTPSLEALQAYTRALDEGRVNPSLDAIAHLKRAIELDPRFALAMAQLSYIYTNTGQPALAAEWSRRAFDLRDRVSERERYFISWRYYRDATQAYDSGLELARSWTVAYPRDAFAFNSLGRAALALGQYQQAIAPLRESIRLDRGLDGPVRNLMQTLTALNQFDASATVLSESRAAGVDHIALRREAYLLAVVDNDAAGMGRELDAALATPEGLSASNWRARVSAFDGRIASAHQEFRRSVAATSQADFTELAGLYGAQDAVSHAVVGQCEEARDEALAAIDRSRDSYTLESAGRALAWCGATAEAERVSGELAQRFPDAILTRRAVLPVMAAATAIRSGRPARALELLEPVRPFDHAPAAEFWPAYLRGEAHLQLRHHAEAAAEFRSVIDHRGESVDSPLYPLAHFGLGQALSAAGDRAGARLAYQAFVSVWKDADTDLLPLKQVRLELARLSK